MDESRAEPQHSTVIWWMVQIRRKKFVIFICRSPIIVQTYIVMMRLKHGHHYDQLCAHHVTKCQTFCEWFPPYFNFFSGKVFYFRILIQWICTKPNAIVLTFRHSLWSTNQSMYVYLNNKKRKRKMLSMFLSCRFANVNEIVRFIEMGIPDRNEYNIENQLCQYWKSTSTLCLESFNRSIDWW